MAEGILYSNFAEPLFPFNLVVPTLAWLPAYLSAIDLDHQPASVFFAILDTIFVFARARTSALHCIEYFAQFKSLASLLNLDYFAAGHIFDPPYPPRGLHQFVERSSMKCLLREYVSLERLRDQSVHQE